MIWYVIVFASGFLLGGIIGAGLEARFVNRLLTDTLGKHFGW